MNATAPDNQGGLARWHAIVAARAPRILIVQRNNIGDLVLSTPFISELRAVFPGSVIDALVNSYNAPVLLRNPDLNQTFAYEKGKHREKGRSLFSVYLSTWRLFYQIRRRHYDIALILSGRFSQSALRHARATGAKLVAGFADASAAAKRLDIAVTYDERYGRHAVATTVQLFNAVLPQKTAPTVDASRWPRCKVYPDAAFVAAARQRLADRGLSDKRVIGIHISARKPDQRWPIENFIALIHALSARHGCGFMLFWSPGTDNNPLHPGDDEKALAIVEACHDVPLVPFATETLEELIGGVGVPDLFICSDGGAMHLASAQARPIVCMFGSSDPLQWHPWATAYELLRADSHRVADITIEAVTEATARLLAKMTMPSEP